MATGYNNWECIHMTKATKVQEMIKVFNPYPLDKEDYNNFYVDTGKIRSVISASDKIINSLTYGEYPGMKLLFMGHKGSGKSTEIVNISERLKEQYDIINFSIAQEIELIGIQYIDVIFVIMSQIIEYVDDNSAWLKIDHDLTEEMFKYWKTETVFEKVIKDEAQAEAGGEAKISFLKKISAYGKGVFKTGMESKKTIRYSIEPRISYLIELINQLIEQINAQLKAREQKELLIIIEDLDKLEIQDAKELFVLHRKALLSLKAKMILSFPIYMEYIQDYSMIRDDFAECVLFSMIKVRNVDGTENREGIDILKDIVYKRMNRELIEDEALDYIVLKSGGAIRDIFDLLKQAAFLKLGNGDIDTPITIADAKIVETSLKATYERFITSEEHINRLKTVYKDPHPDYVDSVLSDLLRTLSVIEYNGNRWCGVHPLLIDFMNEKGLLNE